ncbi:acireductone dioxygenase [Pseudomonas sp. X10]
MSILSVYHQSSPDLPNKVLTHFDDIAATLAEQGVRFERRQAVAFQEDAVAAHREQVDTLMTGNGYMSHAVLSHDSEHQALLAEHTHDASELCWFVAGRGQLSLRMGEYVYAVLCEKHDVIVVPAGVRRRFDMGENPRCVAIRLFSTPAGEVATFTGDKIAERFPRLDDC